MFDFEESGGSRGRPRSRGGRGGDVEGVDDDRNALSAALATMSGILLGWVIRDSWAVLSRSLFPCLLALSSIV